ncbi:hypothetical protein AAAC13_01495 [Pseudomonas aeruginosa]|uniref:hypothetical protein n=1 Tax=Pseudomonas aeruginosa TaxID=287 RepID=UPI0005B4E56E|nr:hypothetical protein [Pseudomonas aeruginosa]EJH4818729.1 hypothetical protein [Pseudomonas aeruginosa]EKL8566506.1 hypothetical protein [Pseudomonas aeruginosa]EKU4838701.1 hypothetical protein [Pseudomonas aeruginosa]EKU5976146.1 hypothetical protein [Pseudomonas aeruginosa]EKV2975659.1 hypothetical protein [Pseudomonas aeruginosa]
MKRQHTTPASRQFKALEALRAKNLQEELGNEESELREQLLTQILLGRDTGDSPEQLSLAREVFAHGSSVLRAALIEQPDGMARHWVVQRWSSESARWATMNTYAPDEEGQSAAYIDAAFTEPTLSPDQLRVKWGRLGGDEDLHEIFDSRLKLAEFWYDIKAGVVVGGQWPDWLIPALVAGEMIGKLKVEPAMLPRGQKTLEKLQDQQGNLVNAWGELPPILLHGSFAFRDVECPRSTHQFCSIAEAVAALRKPGLASATFSPGGFGYQSNQTLEFAASPTNLTDAEVTALLEMMIDSDRKPAAEAVAAEAEAWGGPEHP